MTRLRRLHPSGWTDPVRGVVVGAAIAVVCWYFGTDAWHAILFGSVLSTLLWLGDVLTVLDDTVATEWRDTGATHRVGAGSDILNLSYALRGGFRGIGDNAIRHVRQIARERLARHGLDLGDPADGGAIAQLIGGRAYAVVAPRRSSRRTSLRSLLACLDALDALDKETS